MTIPRPTWAPSTYDELVADIGSRRVYEHHYLELKREYKPSQNQEMAGDLASMANDGGVLVVGVDEDKTSGCATAPTPVVLQGFIERVEQVARSADPPLEVECFPLADPDDKTRGVVFVHVGASSLAPHQANHRYYGRNERTTYKLSDAEIERLIGRRALCEDRLTKSLDAPPGFSHVREAAGGRFAVIVAPSAGHNRELLADMLAPTNFYTWIDERARAADAALQQLIGDNPVLGHLLYSGSPFSGTGGWSNPRTTTGVARLAGVTTAESHSSIMWLGTDESGAANFAMDRIVGPERNVVPAGTVFEWRWMISATAWTVLFVRELCESVGLVTGVDVAVRATGLAATFPEEMSTGDLRGILARHSRHAWPDDEYRGIGHVPFKEAQVGIQLALHSAFGRLLRSTGMGAPFRPN